MCGHRPVSGPEIVTRSDLFFPSELDCDELEAVVLGSLWVAANGDPLLAGSARAVLAKLEAAASEEVRWSIEHSVVATPPAKGRHDDGSVDIGHLRRWTRQERKLAIRYLDDAGIPSLRTVWPILIGYGATSRMLIAWCELRDGFRMFRTDRLKAVEFLDQPYPEVRAELRRRWLTMMETNHDTGRTAPSHD